MTTTITGFVEMQNDGAHVFYDFTRSPAPMDVDIVITHGGHKKTVFRGERSGHGEVVFRTSPDDASPVKIECVGYGYKNYGKTRIKYGGYSVIIVEPYISILKVPELNIVPVSDVSENVLGLSPPPDTTEEPTDNKIPSGGGYLKYIAIIPVIIIIIILLMAGIRK